jgi:hypothetical protein
MARIIHLNIDILGQRNTHLPILHTVNRCSIIAKLTTLATRKIKEAKHI